MDLLIICRDALASSLISDLQIAIKAREKGSEVEVVFTAEALAALAGGTWDWPYLLRGRDVRVDIAKNAAATGIPVISSRDKRQTDLSQLVKAAADKGVKLTACPVWSGLLGLKGKVPAGLQEITMDDLLARLQSVKKVIGTF